MINCRAVTGSCSGGTCHSGFKSDSIQHCQQKYCIRLRSGGHGECHGTNWMGDPIQLRRNNNLVYTYARGLKDRQYCFKQEEINLEEDTFELKETGNDGVCIRTMTINSEQILNGPNHDRSHFYFDGNTPPGCDTAGDKSMVTKRFKFKNGQILDAGCNAGDYFNGKAPSNVDESGTD